MSRREILINSDSLISRIIIKSMSKKQNFILIFNFKNYDEIFEKNMNTNSYNLRFCDNPTVGSLMCSSV